MLRPLQPGDTIGIVSPASPLTADKLDFVIAFLRDEGFKTKVFPHALDDIGYLAGTDADRTADFQAAFADPEVAAVLCSRGGYGCARIVDSIDWKAVVDSRKALLGFSDITTFHLAIQAHGGMSIHSPMALTLHYPRTDYVYESFRKVIHGDVSIPLDAPTGETVVAGQAEGITIGGCMCLLTDSIATKNALDPKGKILFIEDVDEAPHRVDAMLTHLLNSGLIAKAAGIVIGEMTRSDERYDDSIGGRPWREIVIERLAPLGIPMVIGYPFGHFKGMLTVPFGVKAVLDASAGTVRYLQSPFL